MKEDMDLLLLFAALRPFLVRQNVQMLWCLAHPANSAYSFSDVDGRLWTVC